MGADSGAAPDDSMEFNNDPSDIRPTLKKKKNKKRGSFGHNDASRNPGGATSCFSCLNPGHISHMNSHIENRRDIKDLRKSWGGTHATALGENSQITQENPESGKNKHNERPLTFTEKYKPKNKGKIKKYRESEPCRTLKNDGLYEDIYQGMYGDMQEDQNKTQVLHNESECAK